MASPTKKVQNIRKRKLATKGKKRKALVKRFGTTKTAAQLFGDTK